MKKLLSLVLALVMVVGVMAPVKVNAVGEDQYIFNELKTKFGPAIQDLGGTIVKEALGKFIDKGFIDIAYNKGKGVLNTPEYNTLKNYIESDLKISGDVAEDIVGALNTSLNNKISREKLIDDLKSGTMSNDSATYIENTVSDINDALGISLNGKLAAGKTKTDVVLAVFDILTSKMVVTEKADGDFTLSTKELSNSMFDDYFDMDFKPSDRKLNLVDPISKVVKELEGPVNTAKVGYGNTILGSIITKLGGTYNKYVAPTTPVDPTPPSGGGSTGGGSGGGGGGSTAPTTPTPPTEVEVPEDSKDPITVTIGKESVTITTNAEGTTTIVVKETETIKAVEALRKEAGKDREATIVVELADVKGLDFVASLPSKLIESLVKNNVSIQIKTAESEVYIPAETLAGINIPAGSTLELRVDEVANTEATKVAPVGNEVKRVVDLSLIVINGTEQRYITTFRSPITVKIDVKGLGNIDKLAVYYLNEDNNTLEFVTGKTEDNNVVLKLRHFSKYVIVESNKTFKDIIGHWSKKFVESMAAKNVVSGYDSETFRPEGEVTRAEFARMIVGALELDVVKYDGNFADVKADAWYADYVATMNKAGFVAGYSDGTFKPDNKITRAEMAQMLSNALDFEVKSTETNSLLGQFKDLETIQTWSKAAIAKVAKAKVMVGDDNKNFNPISTATRAEATTAIYNLYNK